MVHSRASPATGTAVKPPVPPPSTPRFHKVLRGLRAPHVFVHEILEEFGDFVCWRGIVNLYFVNHPDLIRPVLSQSYEHFSKRNLDYRVLAVVAGNGLISNDGSHWVKQRALMQPLFSHRNVNGFDETINALTSSLMNRWDARAGDGIEWLDRDMSELTFRIAGATLFGSDIKRHAGDVAEMLDVINVSAHDPRALMALLPWIPTPHNLKVRRAKRHLDQIVRALIAARRRRGPGGGDILDRLLGARDRESGAPIDETQIRDEVVTLLLAGHETSANALAWTLYLLATHPEVEARLAEELDAHLGGAPATAADLPGVPYLKQVVQESMRIYPPAWGYSRRAEHEVEIGGYVLPAGAYVAVVPYALHRHPEFWPHPDRFDPDRFHPNRAQARHSYCYLPFGAGPRTCIGAGMAMLETQLVLAQIVQRFRVRVVPDHPIEIAAKVTLTPRYGVPVILSRR